jgi:hypothetical protein
VSVPDADREPAALEGRFDFDDTEHLHAIFRDGVFFAHGSDVAQRKRINERPYNVCVRDRTMGCSSGRGRYERQLLARQLAGLGQKYSLSFRHSIVLISWNGIAPRGAAGADWKRLQEV